MLKEFREFAMKGNMLDLAIGIVIGAAFGAVVNSLVTDIFTPLIGVITGGVDFKGRTSTINGVAINWGLFINAIINFLIVAFALFLVVKAVIDSAKRSHPHLLATKWFCSLRFATLFARNEFGAARDLRPKPPFNYHPLTSCSNAF